MAGQHKATMRVALRSALAHKRLANEILDSLTDAQTKWNATVAKLNVDTAAALDTNYAAGSIANVFEADLPGAGSQHKATLRQSLISALAHKKLANEIADALEEVSVAYNAMLVKLDAQAGELTDTDWVATLATAPVDADGVGSQAQHKATLRKSLQSALANKSLADSLIDGIIGLQKAINGSLAALDAGNVVGAHAVFAVIALTPDA